MDKLDLGGGLNELGAQVTRVKSQKTSKLNLLAKAIWRFEEAPAKLVVWREVTVCKDKPGIGIGYANGTHNRSRLEVAGHRQGGWFCKPTQGQDVDHAKRAGLL